MFPQKPATVLVLRALQEEGAEYVEMSNVVPWLPWLPPIIRDVCTQHDERRINRGMDTLQWAQWAVRQGLQPGKLGGVSWKKSTKLADQVVC